MKSEITHSTKASSIAASILEKVITTSKKNKNKCTNKEEEEKD